LKTALTVFVLTLLVAGIYLLLANPVYEGRAIIKVGQVGPAGQLEETGVLEQRLLAEYNSLEAVERGTENILTLIVTANEREAAKEHLTAITDDLLEEHRNRFHAMRSPLRERREALGIRLADYRQQLNELDIRISQLRGEQPVQAAVLLIEKGNVTRAIPELEEKLAELDRALSEPRTRQTEILGEIAIPENPIKPRTGLILVLSVVPGLILGIFAAFFAGFIAKARTSTTGKEM